MYGNQKCVNSELKKYLRPPHNTIHKNSIEPGTNLSIKHEKYEAPLYIYIKNDALFISIPVIKYSKPGVLLNRNYILPEPVPNPLQEPTHPETCSYNEHRREKRSARRGSRKQRATCVANEEQENPGASARLTGGFG